MAMPAGAPGRRETRTGIWAERRHGAAGVNSTVWRSGVTRRHGRRPPGHRGECQQASSAGEAWGRRRPGTEQSVSAPKSNGTTQPGERLARTRLAVSRMEDAPASRVAGASTRAPETDPPEPSWGAVSHSKSMPGAGPRPKWARGHTPARPAVEATRRDGKYAPNVSHRWARTILLHRGHLTEGGSSTNNRSSNRRTDGRPSPQAVAVVPSR